MILDVTFLSATIAFYLSLYHRVIEIIGKKKRFVIKILTYYVYNVLDIESTKTTNILVKIELPT